MVDIQIRGADGLAGAYGIGPFGLSYSVSGGTNGVQVQFQIAAFDLAVKDIFQVWRERNLVFRRRCD